MAGYSSLVRPLMAQQQRARRVERSIRAVMLTFKRYGVNVDFGPVLKILFNADVDDVLGVIDQIGCAGGELSIATVEAELCRTQPSRERRRR